MCWRFLNGNHCEISAAKKINGGVIDRSYWRQSKHYIGIYICIVIKLTCTDV